MKLIQTLENAIHGYWDGGAKKEFHWSVDPHHGGRDSRGEFVRVGSWDANHWFSVSKGKTEKQTLGNARRKLMALAREAGAKCTFTYKE